MYKYSKDLLNGLRTLADDNFDTLADYIESPDANLGKFYDLLVNTADAFDKLLKFIKDWGLRIYNSNLNTQKSDR